MYIIRSRHIIEGVKYARVSKTLIWHWSDLFYGKHSPKLDPIDDFYYYIFPGKFVETKKFYQAFPYHYLNENPDWYETAPWESFNLRWRYVCV